MKFDNDKFWKTCDRCGKVVKDKKDMRHLGDEHNIFISYCAPCNGEKEDVEYED